MASVWRHRHLIAELARREAAGRFRGAYLGTLWTVLSPLMTIAVFTFVFTMVFEARWNLPIVSRIDFALILFLGLILFSVVSEPLSRAPALILENPNFVKKTPFPVEVLPCVTVAVCLLQAGLSFLAFLAIFMAARGMPPLTALALPLMVLPVALFSLGASWFLAALGVYVRDIRQMIGVVVMLLMFASPVFYPLSSVPEPYRDLIAASPITVILEQSRAALFAGQAPEPGALALYAGLGWLAAWGGYGCFMAMRRGFADAM